MSWTTPRTWVTAELVSASLLNTHLRDNLLALYSRTVNFLVVPDISNAVSPGIAASGIVLLNGVDSFGEAHFSVPANYVSGMTATPIVRPTNTGNLYWALYARYGANGEDYNNHTDTRALGTTAVTASQLKVLSSLSLTNVAIGDYVSLEFERDASNVADTSESSVNLLGIEISYTAGG